MDGTHYKSEKNENNKEMQLLPASSTIASPCTCSVPRDSEVNSSQGRYCIGLHDTDNQF
jgi:hypothetical protein